MSPSKPPCASTSDGSPRTSSCRTQRVEIRAKGRRRALRLTVLGLDRLTEHLSALQRVANAAAELVTAQRVARSRVAIDAERRPADSL
jgi:hypothetical protein